MYQQLRRRLGRLRAVWRLPAAARAELRADRRGLPGADPGPVRAAAAAVAWLGLAQDCSASHDGGVARHFSLLTGWSTSYPETTGYIIPTLLDYAARAGDEAARHRARRMLDWLVSIQLPEGGFQGGLVDSYPAIPVTFNTGQILIGLAAGVRVFGDAYRPAMLRAADWLVDTQDTDGCWRRFATPFASPGEKVYETHVAWGLFEAARLVPDRPYADKAMANVRWALRAQQANGWLDKCCLDDPAQPLTHTLGYALRGILEAYRFSQERSLLDAAAGTADGMLSALGEEGFLPGRLGPDWKGTVAWACLTGTAQVAACWFMLHGFTRDGRYREAAHSATRYVRRTQKLDGSVEARGGIKGSFPVDGAYGSYEYPNWACKFFIDANMMELDSDRQHDGTGKG
jgi:hypothetical protein